MSNDILSMHTNEYICFGENETRIISEFDQMICEYIKKYDAKQIAIPALINGEILKTCGYFDKSPDQLTVASAAKKDQYLEIKKEQTMSDDTTTSTNFYFTPAACLHMYPLLKELQPKEPLCLSTKARVYRYEGGEHDGVQHLWDFTVREIVFTGDEPTVRGRLKEMEDFIMEYVSSIRDDVKVQPAYDHFYLGSASAAMRKLQLNNNLKRELVLPLNGKELALASFNFHGNHFSRPFHFDQGGTIVSGCVGFGLERWLQFFK